MSELYVPRLQADARYLDALSGEFRPDCDLEGGTHTLSRLAIGVVEKGRGPEDCRDYVPSWAEKTYAMVEQFDIEDGTTRLTLAERTGRWPKVARFSHEIMRLSGRHYLVVADNRGLEVPYPLGGSVGFDTIQRDVAGMATDFYAGSD